MNSSTATGTASTITGIAPSAPRIIGRRNFIKSIGLFTILAGAGRVWKASAPLALHNDIVPVVYREINLDTYYMKAYLHGIRYSEPVKPLGTILLNPTQPLKLSKAQVQKLLDDYFKTFPHLT